MGTQLWKQFLEDEVEDIQKVLSTVGAHGLLAAYDDWLDRNCYIKTRYVNHPHKNNVYHKSTYPECIS